MNFFCISHNPLAVLNSFAHQDSRVHYFSCEALYDITRVVREDFFNIFHQNFCALCKLSTRLRCQCEKGYSPLDWLFKVIK
ncbi:hypothetical protein VitviT2T_026614 [Vitis vinifera]|uniref:Uncharacterized protein n=2 Tax=Vitis vinifera TaxID=29760 RepID=A0ABY9DMU6_VITVI